MIPTRQAVQARPSNRAPQVTACMLTLVTDWCPPFPACPLGSAMRGVPLLASAPGCSGPVGAARVGSEAPFCPISLSGIGLLAVARRRAGRRAGEMAGQSPGAGGDEDRRGYRHGCADGEGGEPG